MHPPGSARAGRRPFSPSLDADVAYQSKLLGDARVEVIALAQTSASLFADDYDEVTVKRMTDASGALSSLTSAQAIGRALRCARNPEGSPWRRPIPKRSLRARSATTRPGTGSPSSPRRAWARPIRMPSARWTRAWRKLRSARIDRADIDALVVLGGNFPTMDWIAPWERQFGKPVITTNLATLWALMRTMRIGTPLPGKGRLLKQMPEG